MKEPEKKEYEKPKIVFETDLEIRAGSPLVPDQIDPLDLLGTEE